MAPYRRVYDSRHMQADCQEPGSAPGTLRSVIEYGLPLPFYVVMLLTFILIIISISSPRSLFQFMLKTFLFCKSFPP